MSQEVLKNYVVRIKIDALHGAMQCVNILARSKWEAINKVYEGKNFKYREPNRNNYKAIEPLIKLR